jgi:hypothetical protein
MSQELIKYETILTKILSKLYTANVLTSSDISKILSDVLSTYNKVSQVKKYMNILELLGMNVLPDVMIHKFKLMMLLVIAKFKRIKKCSSINTIAATTPYVRSLSLVYPKTIVSILYIPEDINVHEVLGDDVKNIAQIYRYTVRSKPIPEYLFKLMKYGDTAFNEISFSTCIENALKLSEDWSKRARISYLVLRVLDILLLDPKLTIDEVKDRMREILHRDFDVSKIKRYVRQATKFIYGYRVSIVRSPYISNIKLCLVVKGISDVSKFCLSAVRHPLAISCSWNDLGDSFVCFSLPESGKALAMFKEDLYQFIDWFGAEVVEELEYVYEDGYTTVINIPYGEWSPLLRSWRKFRNVVPSIINKLKESGCVEV